MAFYLKKERIPSVVYEADDYEESIAPYAHIIKNSRSSLKENLGVKNEGEYEFGRLDNIGRLIRVFEVENRIFLTNENGHKTHLSDKTGVLPPQIYKLIRIKILAYFGIRPDTKSLLWLLNNLKAIHVNLNGDKTTDAVFVMKSDLKGDMRQSCGKYPYEDHLN